MNDLKSKLFDIFSFNYFYSKRSYAQQGEDLILKAIFNVKKNDFYVDVGAYHPYRYSNTYLLYKTGWRGINIDPNSDVKKLFDQARPEDINLPFGISDKSNRQKLFMFSNAAFNMFIEKRAKKVSQDGQSELVNEIVVKTTTLNAVLDKQAKSKKVDVLNIDVEGYEYKVLRSNDWKKCRPKVVLVESLGSREKKSKISGFMKSRGYDMVAKTTLTEIYTR